MTVRFYLVPAVTAWQGTREIPNSRTAKYFRGEFPIVNVKASLKDYGLMPTFLVAADVNPAEHALLAAQSDVVSVPEDLTSKITAAQLPAVISALEDLLLPGGWIVADTLSYNNLLRKIMGFIQFAQRYNGFFAKQIFSGTLNLTRTVSSVSQLKRDEIEATALSFGYDSSAITGSWTLGQVMKHYADEWGDTDFHFGTLITLQDVYDGPPVVGT